MRMMSDSEFDDLLQKQRDCTGTQNRHDFEIAGADLSALRLEQRELAGSLIALCRFPAMHLDGSADLYGVSWIGNQLEDCVFDGVSMNKGELLDCVLRNCTLRGVSLFRADLSGTVFQGCRLIDLDLSQKTSLSRVAFRDCRFENVRLDTGRVLNGQGHYVLASDGSVVADHVA